MTDDLCVQTHRQNPDRPRPALDGLRLCHGHHTELRRLIAELPARHADLTRPRGAGGPKITHKTDPGLHIDEAAANLRTQIQHDLLWWCTYVTRERGLLGPRRDDPFTIAAWLTLHVEWLAANEHAALHLLPVLRELTGRAIGITDIPARHIQLDEQCRTHEDGDRCDGIITIVVRGDEWTARCPECRIDQDPTPYLRAAQTGQWITADGVIRLAAVYGITADGDVVRQWKHRKNIRGIIGDVENLYESRSVLDYLTKRQADRERIGA